MVRPPSSDKSNGERRPWTAEEDAKLLAYVSTHGSTGNWDSVPEKAGLDRCGNGCGDGWPNPLTPYVKHERFTPEEEERIITLHAAIGNRWSVIATQFRGRTDNDVKIYWKSKLSKKLLKKGIDPITHRPISEIMQIINSLPTAASNTARYQFPRGTQTNNLDLEDLNSALLSKSTPKHCDASTITIPTDASSNETSNSFSTVVAPSVHSWKDYLINDLFEGDSEPNSMEESTTGADKNGFVDEWWGAMDGNIQGPSCDDGSSSFVDAMLDRHQETLAQFPELLEFLDDPDYIDPIDERFK